MPYAVVRPHSKCVAVPCTNRAPADPRSVADRTPTTAAVDVAARGGTTTADEYTWSAYVAHDPLSDTTTVYVPPAAIGNSNSDGTSVNELEAANAPPYVLPENAPVA